MSNNSNMIPKQKRHPHAPHKKWASLSTEEKQHVFEEKKKTAFELMHKYPDCTEHNLKNAVQQTWGSYLADKTIKQIMKNVKWARGEDSTVSASPVLEVDLEGSDLKESNTPTSKWSGISLCRNTPIGNPPQPFNHKTVLDSMVAAGFTPRQIADHALLMLTELGK